MILQQVELGPWVELDIFWGLVLKEDLKCFVALTLDLLKTCVPRWEELKVLQVPEVFSLMFLWLGEARVLSGPLISLDRWSDESFEEWQRDLDKVKVSFPKMRLGSWKEELELRLGWEVKTFLVEANLEEWRCENSLFLISIKVFFLMSEVSKESKLEVKLEVKSKDSEDELKHENVLFKWFFEVENESKEDEVKDGLEVSWVWIKEVSKDEWEEVSFKVGIKVRGGNDEKESMTFLKELYPLLFLKMVLTFLSSISFLENLNFFFKS